MTAAATATKTRATLTADESLARLTSDLKAKRPFYFSKFGDGFLTCVYGGPGFTCDGEAYTPGLAGLLIDCWRKMLKSERCYLGDWMTASFERGPEMAREWEDSLHLPGIKSMLATWLHFECMLLMRESQELVEFYGAIKRDPRKKLYMGPVGNAGVAEMLGAEHLVVPMGGLIKQIPALTETLQAADFDVLIYGAGMAGNVPVTRCWERWPERTYINIGSALDPLFWKKTRRQQISQERARVLLKELL